MIENLNPKGIPSEPKYNHDETRIFTRQNVWYYTCPNGDSVGPFRYRSEAKSSLDKFIEQLNELNTDQVFPKLIKLHCYNYHLSY